MKAPPEVDCLGTSYRIVPANAVMHKSENNHDTLKYYTLFQGCPFCQSTVMMRRRVFEETGVRYETRFVPTEDYALWIELCDRCRFANLDEVLLDYRVHDSNISILKAEEQSRNGNLAQYDKIFRMAGVEDPHLAEIFTAFFQFEHLTKQEFAEVERRIPEIISFFCIPGMELCTPQKTVCRKNPPPFTEDMQPKPLDPYGIAKYAVEMDLKLANEQFGLNYAVIRPHNIVGVYQNIWDRYRNVIGIWIRKSMNNEPLTIFGDGQQKRAFSDVDFYYDPFEKLMTEFNGEIFNLGADKERTILEAAQLVQKCAKNFGFNPDIIHLEPRHEAKFAFCNHDKAKKLLNFKDGTDLEKTINKMFDWALTQPNHPIKNMTYETSKKIYSFWK